MTFLDYFTSTKIEIKGVNPKAYVNTISKLQELIPKFLTLKQLGP